MAQMRKRKPLGDVAMAIMAALADKDRHGYAIVAEVRSLSDGQVHLGTGTLYGALERMQDEGYVAVSGEETVNGRLRRYYCLTGSGRVELLEEIASRERMVVAARERLAGAHE